MFHVPARSADSIESISVGREIGGCLAARERIVAGRGRMKIVLNVFGALLVLFGGVWFLQGINVLPGSFMTGQILWAVYGGIAVVAGVAVLVAANSRRAKP
jgi:hypothetical protein